MGLDIAVGLLARAVEEGDEDEIEGLEEGFAELNGLLAERGLPGHEEPRALPRDAYFEAQIWGYSGLHYVRRLAAWHGLEGLPPPPLAEGEDVAHDPVLARLYDAHDRHAFGPRPLLSRLLGRSAQKPPFEHLLLHSDAEGFYLPRDLADVVVDPREPQRPFLGGMVGSSPRLLDECRVLARAIDLPETIEPNDDQLLDAAEERAASGPLWQVYGVEALGLALLIRAAERSIATGAAIAFI